MPHFATYETEPQRSAITDADRSHPYRANTKGLSTTCDVAETSRWDASNELSSLARMALQRAQLQWAELDCHIAWCDECILAHVRDDDQAKAAMQLCGIGPVTASALVASVGDFKQFKTGAQFSSWLGVVPSQNSSNGKSRLGGITKRGNDYLRTLLIQGAKSAQTAAFIKERLVNLSSSEPTIFLPATQ
jgi:transposase